MARHKKNKISNALSYILVVLLIVGVCGFVVFFTNGLTEDFKEFFLIINDKPVLSDISGVNIAYNEPLSVQVRYTFDGIKEKLSGYKVTITANPDTDYSFTVDGKEVKLSDCDVDFLQAFEITYNEKDFRVRPKGYNLTDLLQICYPGKNVVADNTKQKTDLFVLTVYSYNDKAAIKIWFSVYEHIHKITLDKGEIVF